MDMFGGLTKTSSRIAIAAAFGLALGGYAVSTSPANAADLGGDCCADLEERVAELEATTVRKGNKKVSVTISGWVVKLGEWWDDGSEQNFYVGDKHTTLSSHVQISGSAQISPGWSGGYTLSLEMRGGGTPGDANQFNDNPGNAAALDILSNQNVLLSYMWVKSDKWGTVNWGQLSQATDNVSLLPDLSGTIIESNAVLFDGQGMFLRAKGANGSNGLTVPLGTWGGAVNCISGGGGIGADCNGYPQNGFRYDSPTFGGFSVSGGVYEDDVKDVAVKWAADWGTFKMSAAGGYTIVTDEGCPSCAPGVPPGSLALLGGGGIPLQGYRKDVDVFQIGASTMHVPSGLFVYGQWSREENNGTQLGVKQLGVPTLKGFNSTAQNRNDVWFFKAGIKRTWSPLGATTLFGEWGQYDDQYSGLCNTPGIGFGCGATVQVGTVTNALGVPTAAGQVVVGNITGSEVTRYGVGVVQEIDSAAMHLFARWQHLELDIEGQFFDGFTGFETATPGFQDQDLFQIGGVIFF
jgi:hypothetical protein